MCEVGVVLKAYFICCPFKLGKKRYIIVSGPSLLMVNDPSRPLLLWCNKNGAWAWPFLHSGHFHKKLVQPTTKLSLLLMLKVHIKYNANLKLGHWEKRKKHGLMRRGRRIHKIPMVELELPPTICGQKLNKNDGGKEIERPHRNRIWIFFRHLVYLCPQNWSHRRLGSGGWRHP